jgi:hypothetical protein
MKTAMQEMIEYLENTYYVKEILDWEDIKKNILEKEKEQIKKANMDGYKEGCTYHSFDHQPKTTEQYYNQTYNQNK